MNPYKSPKESGGPFERSPRPRWPIERAFMMLWGIAIVGQAEYVMSLQPLTMSSGIDRSLGAVLILLMLWRFFSLISEAKAGRQ